MRQNSTLAIAFTSLAVYLATGICGLRAQTLHDSAWQNEAKPRLQAIYERGEFRPRSLRAEWLPDSSGYTIRERDPKTKKSIVVSYDVRTGKRTEAESPKTRRTNRGKLLSPDGKRLLEFRDGNLFVRDLQGGRRTQLTKRSADRDISFRSSVWSLDGKRVAFVESDSTNVRLRPVLVPNDPSYPGIENHRFARVGEQIAVLRVGVVDSNGNQIQWLPIDAPQEGFYLDQVEWAGNSDEVLVEKLSRFRDKRDFVLSAVDGQVKQIFHESNAAWAVGSQGKNSGLTWVDGGKAFIVVSEKDGWRHAFLYSREGRELSLL
ncbi:MAG TPA: S9 family peptidase, partial [Fuerstia sp.]|nr:S9 family peptidase [Fuerstiella sp.]